MMGKVTSMDSLLGMPVKLSNGIADKKQQSNLHTQAVSGHGQGTEPKQLSTGVVCWNSIRINFGLI